MQNLSNAFNNNSAKSMLYYNCSKNNNLRRECFSVRSHVKWFNNEKGYGFIQYKDNEDIFVHYSAISKEGYKTLKEGEYVEFKLIETPKGLQAINVCSVEMTTI